MKKTFSQPFRSYYRAIANGLYDLAQRKALLGLILRSEGVNPGTEEYESAFNVVFDVIEREGLDEDINSACNVLLMCTLDGSGEDRELLKSALEELVAVVEKRGSYGVELEDWATVINRAPRNDDERLSRALRRYSVGSMEGALEDLDILARLGSIEAIKLLGVISIEALRDDVAYYSYSLMEHIYRDGLKWSVPQYIVDILAVLKGRVEGDRLEELDTQVIEALQFILKRERQIGFV